jgi:O-antigen/teichoic acid export membrane protein
VTYVRTTSISNVRWVSISQVGRLVIQLIGISILARLLAPSDYGLLAMATVVTTFASLFRDMGTSAALIQTEAPTAQLQDTVFWFNIALGLLLGVLVAATSHFVSIGFREPQLQGILLMLAIAFPVLSSGTVHLTLMERDSRFREIAWVEISSSTLGLGSALIAVCYGLGVYSLVVQTLTTAAASTIQLWIFSRWRPVCRWDRKDLHRISSFSGNLLGFNIINYFANNADSMLIGHFLGAADLGRYNVGYRIMLFPLQNITHVINRALFPIYSRLNQSEIAKYYLKTLSLLALVISPIVLGLWAVRRPLVEVVLGEKWISIVDVLAWFGPAALLHCLLSSTGVILMATGRTHVLRNLGILSSGLRIASFFIGVQFGIVGVAAAYFFGDLLIFGIVFYVVLKCIDLRISDLVRSIWQPAAIAVFMAVTVMMAEMWLSITQVQAWLQLAILIPAGAGLYFALTAAFSPDLLALLKRVTWQQS